MSNAPSDEMPCLLPKVTLPSDKSTYNSNDDEKNNEERQDHANIQTKIQRAWYNVSDFIEEKQGYLALCETMHAAFCEEGVNILQSAQVLFEFGWNQDGFWDDKFMTQMTTALTIAKAKYLHEFTNVWVFDRLCGRKAFAEDALVVSCLRKNPGGAKPAMRDNLWAGKLQKLVEADGTPKEAAKILEERGIQAQTFKLADMRIILANHDDRK